MLGKRKTFSLIMSAILLLSVLSGCGTNRNGEIATSTEESLAENGEQRFTPNGDRGGEGSGRYTEARIDLSGYLRNALSMTKGEDDSIVIFDRLTGMIVSEDNGVTWRKRDIPGIDDYASFTKEQYALDMKMAADGTIAILFTSNKAEGSISPSLMLIYPDGNRKTFEIPVSEKEMYVRSIWFSPEGELFATTLGDSIFQIDIEDGSSKLFLTQHNRADLIQFQGNFMMMQNAYDGILLYDRNTESYVEDQVLEDFMEEYYGTSNYNAYETYSVFCFPGEENVIYIAGESGLYRHVIGGSMMELVIEGESSSFMDPSLELVAMLALDNHEFLALFTGGNLIRFRYDADANAPGKDGTLTVYSLREQDAIRLAIARFKVLCPGIDIRYEIGMDGADSITREDAVKELNTEIMAGNGPDVLILDDLPIGSYREKGVLLDMGAHVQELMQNTDLLPGIIEGFTQDGKVYMLPATFKIPVVSGDSDVINRIVDLDSLAEETERLRQENPGKNLIGIFSRKAAVAWFLSVSAPAFLEGSNINEEVLSDYLTQVKRIFDASWEGISEQTRFTYEQRAETWKEDPDWAFNNIAMSGMEYAGGELILIAGMLNDFYTFTSNNSLPKVEGLEKTGLTLLDGHAAKVYCPSTLTGINAASKQTDLAYAFLDTLMGKEVQELLGYNGFAVNEQAWEAIFHPDRVEAKPGEIDTDIVVSGSDGTTLTLNIYVPTEEEIQVLRELLYSVRTPYIADPALEEVIIEEGAAYLEGRCGLKEAIGNIKDRVELHLAE